MQQLSVREIKESDIPLIINYWLTAEPAFLTGMGVDLDKMPLKEEWRPMLTEQIQLPYEQKKSYCTIWELNGKPIGHCNVNNISFGEEASMHLHIWYADERKTGLGVQFIKMSLPFFFKNLLLKKICCDPYAHNPAPNKTLSKAGFTFIKEYFGFPGSFSFEQPANHWEITAAAIK
jgi:RimJ/RimL family protein N-acetyltransferase